jgi:acyl-coenzyme A synthetase/AMP-(fatty) acid ligase
MTIAYPLTRHDKPDAAFAIDQSGPVTVEKFLSNVAAIAAILPRCRHVINLCSDRYRFTVALAAALINDQLSLMPPSDNAGVLGRVAAEFDDLYAIYDGQPPAISTPSIAFPVMPAPAPASRPAAMPSIPADRPAVVFFTSGSTGRPMPHMKTWGSLVRSSRAAGARLGVARMPAATIIGTVPQQHSYGLESTVMLALQQGLALHHARPFYPSDVAACIDATAAPRLLVTTPIHLRAMLADPTQLPAVDLVVSATAPLAPQLATEAERRFGAPLLEIYGCSEAGQLATRRPVASDEWQCLDDVALRQDSAGSWAAGPSVEGDVLLNDIIELHGPTRFLLHGRTADLVNIAGKRTSLAHLNYHLNAIPGVRDGVFIMPDDGDDGRTRLMALVVAPGLTADSLLAALRQRLDPAFLPRPLRLVEALPRTPLGKLTRDAVVRLTTRDGERDQ